MSDLTPEQMANAKKVIDELLDYLWNKVMQKVSEGLSYEQAVAEVLNKAVEEGKHNA